MWDVHLLLKEDDNTNRPLSGTNRHVSPSFRLAKISVPDLLSGLGIPLGKELRTVELLRIARESISSYYNDLANELSV